MRTTAHLLVIRLSPSAGRPGGAVFPSRKSTPGAPAAPPRGELRAECYHITGGPPQRTPPGHRLSKTVTVSPTFSTGAVVQPFQVKMSFTETPYLRAITVGFWPGATLWAIFRP